MQQPRHRAPRPGRPGRSHCRLRPRARARPARRAGACNDPGEPRRRTRRAGDGEGAVVPAGGRPIACTPARLRPGVAALLVAAVSVCFLPALGSQFVLWDDDMNFTDNPSYRGLSASHLRWMFTTLYGGHYQPLSWLTLGLDYTIWAMNPTGYHLTNLLLHAASALLVYRMIVALVPGVGARAALAGALLFAIHPLRVESVAWATERRDVLSALFYLATVLGYLRLVQAKRDGRPWRGWLAASVGCFLLSLLSMAWGITLPLVLLALDVYPLRRLVRRRDAVPLLLEKIPYAALALGGAVLAQLASNQVPAKRTLAQHGLVERAAQAAYGLVFYLWKTLVPIRLSPVYLLEQTLRPTAPRYLASAAIVVGVTAAAVLLRRRAPWATVARACYAPVPPPSPSARPVCGTTRGRCGSTRCASIPTTTSPT